MKPYLSVSRLLFLLLFSFLLVQLRAQDNTLSAKEKKDGWQLLFDGVSMGKWRSGNSDTFPSKGWKIQDGLLLVDENGGRQSGGDIITRDRFNNFEFTTDFKLTEGANSGIKYNVQLFNPPVRGLGMVLGPEYQLLDDDKHPDAKAGRDGNRKLGSLYDILPSAAAAALRPVGEWNTARIVVKGGQVEHWLNGVKVLSYERNSDLYKTAFAQSKFKEVAGYGNNDGFLLLQDHGNKVFFKNIKVRKI